MPLPLPAMLLAWELNDSSVFEVKICKKTELPDASILLSTHMDFAEIDVSII